MTAFSSDSDEDRFASLLIRTARLLPLNSTAELNEMKVTVDKICKNILDSPQEKRFQRLHLHNRRLRRSLLDLHAGGEVCRILNFRKVVEGENQETVLAFASEGSGEVSEQHLEFLKKSSEWFDLQIAECLRMSAQSGQISDVCAECVIQIRLSNGKVYRGGFYRDETLQNVKEFVNAVFPQQQGWVLQQPFPSKVYNEEDLTKSLTELDLVPRASLVAFCPETHFSEQELSQRKLSETRMQRAHNMSKQSEKDRISNIRRENIEKAQLREKDRARSLAAFRDDRVDMQLKFKQGASVAGDGGHDNRG